MTGYRDTNGTLRKGGTPKGAYLIDSVIKKSALDQDLVVYRGLSLQNAEQLGLLEEGAVLSDPAYQSTSSNRDVAGKFASWVSERRETPLVMKIELSKGAKAFSTAVLENSMKDEFEYILPRGQKFQVVSAPAIESYEVYGEERKVATMTVRPL